MDRETKETREAKELKELGEIKSASEDIYRGVIMHVVRDTVTLPNGKETHREVVRHVGAVCVIPVTDDNKVITERQFRYPINRVITEIPAGKLDSKSEDRLSAAKRELSEETGISADEWTDLGDFCPAAAYSDERITMFMARKLHFGERHLDDGEFLDVNAVPLSELVQAVESGEIIDAKTQMAILRAARILGI